MSDHDDDSGPRVTPLELFFDLVFVFAFTQVTTLLREEASWNGLARGLLLLSMLWWAWAAYAWLTNTLDPEEGTVRLAVFASIAAMLIASLAAPRAFGRDGVTFAVAYLVVRVLHLVLFSIAGRDDPDLLGAVLRLVPSTAFGTGMLLVAGLLGGPARIWIWLVAVVTEYAGALFGHMRGWRVSPHHFVERFAQIFLIALGESIVALGVGAGGVELDAGIITAALLGIAIAGALWWSYFDVVAIVGERVFRQADHAAQVRMARDSYTYLHLPMVAGIVIFAVGVKKTLAHVGHDLDAVPAVALCGGVALYLTAMSAFKRRNIGSWNRPRLVTAAALTAFIPAATALPALASLAVVAALSCGLIAYEATAYAATRDRIRHAAP